MIILGIETSCDETAASLVEDGRKILSCVVASSVDIHAKTGGIIPENAARRQVESIVPVISQSLATRHRSPESIDAIAVTYGPGLVGSLLVGVETAKALSLIWEKPLIPVNHLVGHIYANWLIQNSKANNQKVPEFPALALVVSGGHTDLVLMKSHKSIEWIGGTRDDAAGEAFDKCARLLGLPYPGGPSIAKEAMKCQVSNDKLQIFPRPLISQNNYDFSFSGLKTSVLNFVTNHRSQITTHRLAAEIQEAIVDVLVKKSIRAIIRFKPKSFLLAGGVAANSRLRELLKLRIENCKLKIDFRFPPTKLCTDNAAYIAAAAFYRRELVKWKELSAKASLFITE